MSFHWIAKSVGPVGIVRSDLDYIPVQITKLLPTIKGALVIRQKQKTLEMAPRFFKNVAIRC
jgi:hypothetical protein